MPWQLIYTSAPRGLQSGQTGFCTVARSGDLREALAQRLEQLSHYHYLRVAEAATANRNPTVCAFRILDLRGTKYYVLTRIQPCGLDFTARTNHLAHHLVFQSEELGQLPSPAAILRHWDGWLASWQGEPRVVEDPALAIFGAAGKDALPAQTWLKMTGDAGRAAGLLEGECVRGCYLVCPAGSEAQVLDLFCETLQLLNLNGQFPLRPWRNPFTTFLQAEDNPADFHWRACQENTPAHQAAAQRNVTFIPLRAVRVPANSLVKVAREGQKPPPAPAEGATTEAILALRKREAARKSFPPDPTMDPEYWKKPAAETEATPPTPGSVTLAPATLLRIGAVAAALLVLWGLKYSLGKRHAPPPIVLAPTPARPEPVAQKPGPRNPPPESLDLTQLDRLSGDGPTYIFVTANLNSFNLPIDAISRLQNLLQRFDLLETRPTDIQLSVNTDEWDYTSGAPLTIKARQEQVLSAESTSGLECSLDYSNWKSDAHNPVVVRASFVTPPDAFSLHFGFAAADKGEPFRLLMINESHGPAPLHLGTGWLRNGDSVAASLQPPLGQHLFGNFMLPADRQWQLRPFVGNKAAHQAHYLYQDWPVEELPPTGSELDFGVVKQHLAKELVPLGAKAAGLSQKLAQQMKAAGLDTPLGKSLGITNRNFASLADYSRDPAPADFIGYLNALKKHSGIKNWPRLFEDDDESQLAVKFHQIHDLWPKSPPGDNYFSATWQALKDMDKIRQDKKRAQDDIDKIQGRLSVVPDAPDGAAYVGLFMIDPPRPGLEMIRFEGP